MAGLAPFFKSNSSFSLKVLICNNNGLGPQGAEVSENRILLHIILIIVFRSMNTLCFQEFSKALIACRDLSIQRGAELFSLKKFVCGRNRMQNKGALAIAKFLQVKLDFE
jgi:Ran GTPase-activating protein (RanGAP) involved in mRNA processing and transport